MPACFLLLQHQLQEEQRWNPVQGSRTTAGTQPAVRKPLTGAAALEIASLTPVKGWMAETLPLCLEVKTIGVPRTCVPSSVWGWTWPRKAPLLPLLYKKPGFLEKLDTLLISSSAFGDFR